MTSTTKQTKQPDPDPLDFGGPSPTPSATRGAYATWGRDCMDSVGNSILDHEAPMDNNHHSLPCGEIRGSFIAATDFEEEEGGSGGDLDLLDPSFLVVPGLNGGDNRHPWTIFSFRDDALDQDGLDYHLTVDPFFSAHGLGSPGFASPESGWFEYPASLDMSAFDDMPAWVDTPPSRSFVFSCNGTSFVDPALLHRPKRHIDRMGYGRRSFDAESYCCHLDSQERIHRFSDHVRDCSRRSQQAVKMTALFDALRFAEHRLMPNPLGDDNPFDQDPAADERRMTDDMIALAELAATAAADLLLLAFSSEAMSNLCCGLQGSSLGGSSNKLAPARLHDGVRERPPCCCPNWRQPPPLAMAA